MVKVNFGSGPGKLPGWINVDISNEYEPDIIADAQEKLPFETASVQYIHSESFFEELPLEKGYGFLRECRRILRPDGVMRMLLLDLEKFASQYLHDPEWLVKTWREFVGVPLRTGSACEVFNLGMQMGGRFQYDRQTFCQVASDCGLRPYPVRYRESEHDALRGLDLRPPDRSLSMYFECVPA